MATPPRTALRLSHEQAETSERRDEADREREREREERRCAALADMQIEEVGVRYVTLLGEPWCCVGNTFRYFTIILPGPGPRRRPRHRWNRGGKKTARSGKDDRGKMIVYDGLDVTIGVIDAP